MKKIQIYIVSFIVFLWITYSSVVSASSNNEESGKSNWWVSTSHTKHPPHDHQEHNHMKKLDEALSKRRKDHKKSH